MTATLDAPSYADLEDVLLRMPTKPVGEDKLARIQSVLADTRDVLDGWLQMDFDRHPATGATEVRTFDVAGGGVVCVHSGVISLTSLQVRRDSYADLEDVATEDYRLEYWANTGERHVRRTGEPYDHIVLTGIGELRTWPRVRAGLAGTGAWGWDRPPRRLRDGQAALVLQTLAADPSFPGGVQAPPDLGRPMGPDRIPQRIFEFRMEMARRFWCDL